MTEDRRVGKCPHCGCSQFYQPVEPVRAASGGVTLRPTATLICTACSQAVKSEDLWQLDEVSRLQAELAATQARLAALTQTPRVPSRTSRDS